MECLGALALVRSNVARRHRVSHPGAMMRPLIAILVIALVSACRATSVAPATAASTQQGAAASRFVDSIAAAQQLPGFAVTVMQGDRVLWRHGIGYADVASAKPATSRT